MCNIIAKNNRMIKDIQLLCANCHIDADLRDNTGTRGKMFREIEQDTSKGKEVIK